MVFWSLHGSCMWMRRTVSFFSLLSSVLFYRSIPPLFLRVSRGCAPLSMALTDRLIVFLQDFDPVACGPVRALPSGFTCWDKVDVDIRELSFIAGSASIQGVKAALRSVTAGHRDGRTRHIGFGC